MKIHLPLGLRRTLLRSFILGLACLTPVSFCLPASAALQSIGKDATVTWTEGGTNSPYTGADGDRYHVAQGGKLIIESGTYEATTSTYFSSAAVLLYKGTLENAGTLELQGSWQKGLEANGAKVSNTGFLNITNSGGWAGLYFNDNNASTLTNNGTITIDITDSQDGIYGGASSITNKNGTQLNITSRCTNASSVSSATGISGGSSLTNETGATLSATGEATKGTGTGLSLKANNVFTNEGEMTLTGKSESGKAFGILYSGNNVSFTNKGTLTAIASTNGAQESIAIKLVAPGEIFINESDASLTAAASSNGGTIVYDIYVGTPASFHNAGTLTLDKAYIYHTTAQFSLLDGATVLARSGGAVSFEGSSSYGYHGTLTLGGALDADNKVQATANGSRVTLGADLSFKNVIPMLADDVTLVLGRDFTVWDKLDWNDHTLAVDNGTSAHAVTRGSLYTAEWDGTVTMEENTNTLSASGDVDNFTLSSGSATFVGNNMDLLSVNESATLTLGQTGLTVGALSGKVGGVQGEVKIGTPGSEDLYATISGTMELTHDGSGTYTLGDSAAQVDNSLTVHVGSVALDDTQLASLTVLGGSVTMADNTKDLTVGSLSGKVGGVKGEFRLGLPGSESLIANAGALGSMDVTGNADGNYTVKDTAGVADNSLSVSNGDVTLDDDALASLTITGEGSKVSSSRDLSLGTLEVGSGSELDMTGNNLTVTESATLGDSATVKANVTLGSGVVLTDNDNIEGSIIVKNGATMKGCGTSSGLVTVEDGGRLHIGNSPGYRDFSAGLTLDNGAIVSFSVDGVTPASAANSGAGTHSYAKVTGGVLTLATGSTAIAQVDIMGNIVTAGYAPFALTLLEVDPAAVNGDGTFTLSLTGQTDLLLTAATTLDWENGKLIFRSMLNPGNVEGRAHESGAAIASTLWSSTSAVRAFARNTTSQLSAPITTENGVTVWGSAIGDYVTMSGFRSNAHGYAVGADKQFCPHFRAGLSFGQMFGDYTADRGLAEVEQDSAIFGLYGEYARELNKRHGVSVTGYAAYGRVDNDADTRVFGLAELPGRASWDDDVFVAGFRANWNMRVTEKTTISPFIGLEYQRGEQGSFTESFDGGSNSYAGGSMQVWSLPVGITASTEVELGGGQKLLPWLTVGYVADVARQNPHMDGSVLGQDYRFEGANPGRHGFMLNAGANWKINESWSAGASYNFETRSHETSHEGNFSVRYSF